MNRVKEILQQIRSTHFATLWLFYRKHFTDDETCLQFLYDAILFNPSPESPLLTTDERWALMANGQSENDEKHLIPLNMLNAVQRLVSAAHDMDQIRRGKDVFKVIYLVTCAETLLILFDEKNRATSKRWLWLRFWKRNVSDEDKNAIRRKFSRDCLSEISEAELEWEDHSDTFELFLNVMNEVRNSAIHNGDHWEHFFNNHGEEPLQFQLNINLHLNQDDKKRLHTFITELSYQEFEDIFVRTSIQLIRNYVAQHTNQQEEPSHADA